MSAAVGQTESQAVELGLSEIYRNESSYVWNSLRRLGAHERDLEDLVHDTFLVVNRRLGDFDWSRPLRPWLYGIAMRVAADARKSARNRHETLSAEPPEPTGAQPGPEEEVSAQQNRNLVAQALDSLDFKNRAIFVMHDINEHTLAEASVALDTPMATLYSRLRVAREQFASAVRRIQNGGGAA
tara:strand:+ start:32780 stop:33331 length:552 start_codon:yes stop_codon:yes gene_type:complete